MNSILTIPLTAPIPAKKNCRVILANGKNIPSKYYRSWHKRNIGTIRRIFNEKGAYSCPVQICVSLCFGDRRKRDLDNALTSVLDLLKDGQLIEDDDFSHVRRITCEYSGFGEFAAVVTITPLQRA